MNLIKYSLEDQIKLKMIFIYDVKWIEKLVFYPLCQGFKIYTCGWKDSGQSLTGAVGCPSRALNSRL